MSFLQTKVSHGERGRGFFFELSRNPRYNDTPEEINAKFSNLLETSEGKIILATLFEIAKSTDSSIHLKNK